MSRFRLSLGLYHSLWLWLQKKLTLIDLMYWCLCWYLCWSFDWSILRAQHLSGQFSASELSEQHLSRRRPTQPQVIFPPSSLSKTLSLSSQWMLGVVTGLSVGACWWWLNWRLCCGVLCCWCLSRTCVDASPVCHDTWLFLHVLMIDSYMIMDVHGVPLDVDAFGDVNNAMSLSDWY